MSKYCGGFYNQKPISKCVYIVVVVVFVSQAWESDETIDEDMPESPGVEKHEREKDHRDSMKGRSPTHLYTRGVLAVLDREGTS